MRSSRQLPWIVGAALMACSPPERLAAHATEEQQAQAAAGARWDKAMAGVDRALNDWHDAVIEDAISPYHFQSREVDQETWWGSGGVRQVSQTGSGESKWRVARWSVPPAPHSGSGRVGPAAVVLVGFAEGEGHEFELTWTADHSRYDAEQIASLVRAFDEIKIEVSIAEPVGPLWSWGRRNESEKNLFPSLSNLIVK